MNISSSISSKPLAIVLIDTWWNVNDITINSYEEYKHVLIDTWWNVNWGDMTMKPVDIMF